MSPEEIRQRADEILSRSEFDEPEPNVADRLGNWLGDHFPDVFDFLPGGGLVAGLTILVAIVGLVVLVRWLRVRRRRPRRRGGAEAGVEIEVVRRRTPAQWRVEATELEGRGEWKLGLRCRYRALVGDLLAEGLVDDVAGRTTGELRADVADRAPERAAAFSAASDLFDLAWYADRPTGPDESARFQSLAASITGVRT